MQIVAISLLTFFASLVGTVSGFGTSTIMIPALLLFFPLPQTLLLVGIIHLFGDIWKMGLFKGGLNWKILLGFGIPGILLSYIGASLSFDIEQTFLTQLLGAFLVIYVGYLTLKPKFRIPKTLPSAISGGALSGFFAGIFGVGGAVRGAFLSAFDLPKSTYLFISGAIAFVIDIVRLTTYTYEGARLTEILLWGLIVFIPMSFAGALVAKKAVDKIPQKFFRPVVAFFLLVIAVKFIIAP